MSSVEISLEVENIAQSISQRDLIFQDISFKWKAPGLHVIMGASGVGKSTFLKTIGGVMQPLSGFVRISGDELWLANEDKENSILSRLGFAFQNNALFSSLRVLENLSFPHRQRFPNFVEHDRLELSMSWLKKVGLEASALQFPHELSGGMQKRLAIARTLMLEPDIVYLDDPTAGLDPITSQQIAALIGDLLGESVGTTKKALVIIVTNDKQRALAWSKDIHFLWKKSLHSPQSKFYDELVEYYL